MMSWALITKNTKYIFFVLENRDISQSNSSVYLTSFFIPRVCQNSVSLDKSVILWDFINTNFLCKIYRQFLFNN